MNNTIKENPEYFESLITEAVTIAEKSDGPFIIAVDGPSGSGKSTVAKALSNALNAGLFHTDDYFLQPYQRTSERYEEPGGNIDRERLIEEILIPLSQGRKVKYRRFDCHTMSLSEWSECEEKRVNIIEGSYSHHPSFSEYINLKIYVEAPEKIRLKRIESRGSDLSAFINRWIPLENKYFSAFAVKESCNLIIENKEEYPSDLP